MKAKEVSAALTFRDWMGRILCRFSSRFRMQYVKNPGLYFVGNADEKSPVLVTANYKLSFDLLRKELAGINAWILVLDTGGINVWCAAGKGTFGTEELVRRIEEAQLKRAVSHSRLVLPQLGAPGVVAADVKIRTGFSVSYGPVRAADLPAYLSAGFRADEMMREVRFPLLDRLVLIPMEFVPALFRILPWMIGLFAVLGLTGRGIIFAETLREGPCIMLASAAGLVGGTVLVPLLLPFIPLRSFALKGFFIGALLSALISFFFPVPDSGIIIYMILLIICCGLSSYFGLMFTGSTPFTNPSGVKRELKISVPVYLTAAAALVILLVVYKIVNWGPK